MTVRTDFTDVRKLDFAPMKQSGNAGAAGPRMTPVSPSHNWVTVNTDCANISDVTIPGNLDENQLRVLRCGQSGTAVLVRLKYPEGQTDPSVTIKVIGFDDTMMDSDAATPIPELLPDVEGNLSITFTPTPATDVQDADGNAYTQAVRVDYHGCMYLIFPSVGADGQGSIQAKVI